MDAQTEHSPVTAPTRGMTTIVALALAIASFLVAGAIWLTVERGPALFLDLAKLPWCG